MGPTMVGWRMSGAVVSSSLLSSWYENSLLTLFIQTVLISYPFLVSFPSSLVFSSSLVLVKLYLLPKYETSITMSESGCLKDNES